MLYYRCRDPPGGLRGEQGRTQAVNESFILLKEWFSDSVHSADWRLPSLLYTDGDTDPLQAVVGVTVKVFCPSPAKDQAVISFKLSLTYL